jgi:hypothetical protein
MDGAGCGHAEIARLAQRPFQSRRAISELAGAVHGIRLRLSRAPRKKLPRPPRSVGSTGLKQLLRGGI